jgi:hypothetical protein
MTARDETTANVLQSVWMVSHDHYELDEDCSPTKPCRNMKDVSFDGWAESGEDLGAAWRAQLAREGKIDESAETLRDLVLGEGE